VQRSGQPGRLTLVQPGAGYDLLTEVTVSAGPKPLLTGSRATTARISTSPACFLSPSSPGVLSPECNLRTPPLLLLGGTITLEASVPLPGQPVPAFTHR
jgi:hypothetical protein